MSGEAENMEPQASDTQDLPFNDPLPDEPVTGDQANYNQLDFDPTLDYPPVDDPPADGPQMYDPPADALQVVDPPVDDPQVDPPVDDPQVDPPVDDPPVDPSADNPPNDDPPICNTPNVNATTGKQKKKSKKKQAQQSGEIVFAKGTTIHTMPSLTKLLKGITECIIGLQYVWEYRSPSKSVQPHYQCKLCSLARLQHDMVDHVKGWKHGFRYMKKVHPDKVTCEEEDAIKDSAVRRAVKAAAAEVESTEGRGQIKVILKEPFDAPAFKGFRSATPRHGPPMNVGMGPPGPPFGPRFPGPGFPGEFPPHRGPPDFSPGEYGGPDFGGYQARDNFPNRGMNRGRFSDGRGRRPLAGGRAGYGRSGPMNDDPRKMFPDGFRSNQMGDGFIDKPQDRPGLMGKAPDTNRLPNTLLTYLDSFRIENENDAQLVLKVTQKLTDVLMEYRLRSVSKGPSLNSLPMSSPNFPSPDLRLGNSSDRFQSLSGPPRYSDGPQRFYK